MASTQNMTEKEETALRLVQERTEQGLKEIRPKVENYWLNHAFIRGHQWLWFNRHARVMEPLPRDEDRVQAVVNRLWPDSRTIISKLAQRDLEFDVLPTAADDATLRGAALAQSVLVDLKIRHDWERIRVLNLWGTWKGGTAAICVDWDPKAGSPITAIDANDDKGEPVFEGDTIETPLSLAEMIVEPGCRDPERATWWQKIQALPPKVVQATYDLDEEPDADAMAGLSPFQQKLIAEEHSAERVDLTMVRTYYERPNALTPKGRIIVVVNERVLFDKPWPFPFKDRLNFALTYETEDETHWTGDTVVTQARSIQVLLNATESNIQEHMKQAGNARMAVPQSAIDLMDSMTDMPGENIPYMDGLSPPTWISPPSMPQWWSERPQQLKETIDDLLGVHDVSRGKAPVNIESGYGLSILSEQDNTPIGKMAKSMAGAWSRVASMVLEIYGSMVKSTRQAVVSAPGQPAETANWTGESLMGQYQAFIPIDAVLPRSRAAQMQVATKMVEMGMVKDIETFSAIADLPGQRQLIERMKPDVAKARRENALMAIGHVRLPANFDDHQAHIIEHNVFRKSERWDRLTDEIRELINEHLAAHEALAGEEMGKARTQAAVDPATAAIPTADERPRIPLDEMPPGALDPSALPGEAEELEAMASEEEALSAMMEEQSMGEDLA